MSGKPQVTEKRDRASDLRLMTTCAQGSRRLQEVGTDWLATVRADGQPHVVPRR